ncbi:hypothetical protein E2C01_040192 [Portunus trituberculatus]|uniref:Uncharacterized protein n=1 Tax=Portunus trituberculatus TaxID=210409 RepID=A0A5B7FJ12_PORTR|nr:hypothetical protein [Portunus trituberculatus]
MHAAMGAPQGGGNLNVLFSRHFSSACDFTSYLFMMRICGSSAFRPLCSEQVKRKKAIRVVAVSGSGEPMVREGCIIEVLLTRLRVVCSR